jgi:transposase
MPTQYTTEPLYVAIDIGKNVHCFAGYAGLDLRPCGPAQSVVSSRTGYACFSAWLAELLASGRYAPVLVGLEPTGTYHEPWAYAIARDWRTPVTLQFINPYHTKRERQQRQLGRRRKTDLLDTEAIAACLRDGLGRPARLPEGAAFRFGVWAATFRRLAREKQRLQAQVLAQFDRLWPGALVKVANFHKAHPTLPEPQPLVRSRPLERKLVQLVLTYAPNPYDWLNRAPQEIQALVQQHGLRCGPSIVKRIYGLVHEMMLLPPGLCALLAEQLQADWSRLRLLQQELEKCRQQAQELVCDSPAAVLLTVPGMSAFLAAAYLAYVVDTHRFRHADQIWSLAGFSPDQEESGDSRYQGQMSRRGNAGFRHILYTIGLNTSQYCPAIGRAKKRALQHGKRPVGANLHAAHLANRLCFQMVRDQKPYEEQRMR